MTGIGIYQYSDAGRQTGKVHTRVVAVKAPEGSAVADLQALDKNADVLADFDLMDEVTQQPNQVQQQ